MRTCARGKCPARGVGFITGGGQGFVTLNAAGVTEAFRAEARALRTAAGHRLPELIDELVTDDGLPVLVLDELSTPWSLESAPVEDFARILESSADLGRILKPVVDHAWLGGLGGHGDLKPEHVFLDADGEFVFIESAFCSGTLRTWTTEYNPLPAPVPGVDDGVRGGGDVVSAAGRQASGGHAVARSGVA